MFGSTFNRFNTLSVVGDSGKLHNEDRSRELEPRTCRVSGGPQLQYFGVRKSPPSTPFPLKDD